jgi:hypothetical protein
MMKEMKMDGGKLIQNWANRKEKKAIDKVWKGKSLNFPINRSKLHQ